MLNEASDKPNNDCLYLQANKKVGVMGASGGIGQPLSLLLKNSPLVTQLSLYDIVHTPGVAADLSHIESPAKVVGYVGPDQLAVSSYMLYSLSKGDPDYTVRFHTTGNVYRTDVFGQIYVVITAYTPIKLRYHCLNFGFW